MTESTTSSIFFVRADGSGLRQLTHAATSSGLHHLPACHELPSSSLDADVIAYTVIGSCSHTPDSSLAAVTSGGHATPIHPIWPDWAIDGEWQGATWAPTGEEIAYFIYAWNPERVGLYVSQINGAHTRRVALWAHSDTVGWPLRAPAWSPDSAFLAITRAAGFSGRTGALVGDVWLIGADGGRPQRLTATYDYTAQTWLPAVRR
jgi:hypothetical protein